MHDLHEANKILKIVFDYAGKNNLKRIDQIVIELGSIIEHGSEILPENLKYNIHILSKNTIAENSEIIIKKTKGGFWNLKQIKGE